mgnify:CR=1 FL=1
MIDATKISREAHALQRRDDDFLTGTTCEQRVAAVGLELRNPLVEPPRVCARGRRPTARRFLRVFFFSEVARFKLRLSGTLGDPLDDHEH